MRTGPRWVLVGLGWSVTAAALLVLVFIGYCAVTLPVSGGSNADEPGPAIVFTAADGQIFASRGAAKGEKVASDQLPADLVHAVIAIEDRRFYSHHGVDLRGILRAASHDLHGDGGIEGASTITQQLARMSYLSPERSLRRKVQEVIIALWLETRLGKDQILARYLNTVYFGAGSVWHRRRGAAVLRKESGIIEPCRVSSARGAHSLADATGADAEPQGGTPACGYDA